MDPCREKRTSTHLYSLLINPSPPLIEAMTSRSPDDPLLLCAGAVNPNISCFVAHPCFSFLCARALNTRFMLKATFTRSPARPLLLCAGAVNPHFSSFFTHPCFSFLCARVVNPRLYVRLCYNASERPGLSALCFCAQGRSIRTFRLFGLLWAPLAAPKLPTWSLLGSAGCPNCLPGRPESLIWCLPGPTGCSM